MHKTYQWVKFCQNHSPWFTNLIETIPPLDGQNSWRENTPILSKPFPFDSEIDSAPHRSRVFQDPPNHFSIWVRLFSPEKNGAQVVPAKLRFWSNSVYCMKSLPGRCNDLWCERWDSKIAWWPLVGGWSQFTMLGEIYIYIYESFWYTWKGRMYVSTLGSYNVSRCIYCNIVFTYMYIYTCIIIILLLESLRNYQAVQQTESTAWTKQLHQGTRWVLRFQRCLKWLQSFLFLNFLWCIQIFAD